MKIQYWSLHLTIVDGSCTPMPRLPRRRNFSCASAEAALVVGAVAGACASAATAAVQAINSPDAMIRYARILGIGSIRCSRGEGKTFEPDVGRSDRRHHQMRSA